MLPRRAVVLLSAVQLSAVPLSGCGHDAVEPPLVTPEPLCAPGERDVGGTCVPAGVQDDGCLAGELGIGDGTCRPAGIPASMCSEGFAPTDDGACEPVLPSGPCMPGMVALPGDTLCHEITSCGNAPWGDIPLEPTTQFVDASYPGGDSDGSAQKPWTTLVAAITAATPGAIVAVAAGSYAEDLVLSGKNVRLWGRCPALVEIAGAGVESSTVFVAAGANGTELHGLAITGSAVAVQISGSVDVRVETSWIHDTPERGIGIESGLGATRVVIADSLVEAVAEFGVFVAGADVTLERVVVRGVRPVAAGFGRGVNGRIHPLNGDRGQLTIRRALIEANTDAGVFLSGTDGIVEGSVVRDTQPPQSLDWGRGIHAQFDTPLGQRSSLTVRGSVVAGNHQAGVFTLASDADLEALVVKGTLPSPLDGAMGTGIIFQQHPMTAEHSTARLASSVVESNHEAGVVVARSDATIEAVIVRDILPRLVDQEEGRGIIVRNDETGEGGSAIVHASLIERAHDHGLIVGASQVTLDGLRVRDILPAASDGKHGRGIAIQSSESGARSNAEVRATVVERTHDVGLFVMGSDSTIDGVLVQETASEELDQLGGRGVVVQLDVDTGQRASALVRSSVVEESREAGLFLSAAEVTVADTLIRDTRASELSGLFGDGVVVAVIGGPSRLVIERSRIAQSARAAVANFGADTSLTASELVCQAFDIVSETFEGSAPILSDNGGNGCGCPEPSDACKAISASLEPPAPLAQ